MRRGLAVVLVVWSVVVVGAQSQAPTALVGRWVRDGGPPPAFDDVLPAWEQIAVTADGVSVRRANRSEAPEAYAWDDVERAAPRVRAERRCRAAARADRLTIACRQIDAGPGGLAPPILTREVRTLVAPGRLVLELTWGTGETAKTYTGTYHKEAQ